MKPIHAGFLLLGALMLVVVATLLAFLWPVFQFFFLFAAAVLELLFVKLPVLLGWSISAPCEALWGLIAVVVLVKFLPTLFGSIGGGKGGGGGHH